MNNAQGKHKCINSIATCTMYIRKRASVKLHYASHTAYCVENSTVGSHESKTPLFFSLDRIALNSK